MLNTNDIALICQGAHGDPFSLLGPHRHSTGRTSVRAFIPGAVQVLVVATPSQRVLATLALRHPDGFFERVLTSALKSRYQLHVRWGDDSVSVIEDPYRFGCQSAASLCARSPCSLRRVCRCIRSTCAPGFTSAERSLGQRQ